MQRSHLATQAALLVLLLGLAASCTSAPDAWPDAPGKKRVVATFAPLYCLTANVAGDDAVVKCLLNTTGPHEYEPSPRDSLLLHRADLFLANGLGLDEQFAETLRKNATNDHLPLIEIGEAIPADQLRKPLEAAGVDTKAEPGHHHHGDHDPHVWLGLPQAMLMVDRIRDELKKIDPAHAAGYDQRAAEYRGRLDRLLADGKAQLAKKTDRRLLTFHDSMQYLGAAFGLEIVASLQASPNEEPSGPRLQKLVDLCLDKAAPVRVIAVEPGQESRSAAQKLLQELQAKGLKDAALVEIDVMEEAAEKDLTPQLYELRMRRNIDNLAKALR